MSIQSVVKMGNPNLSKSSVPVTDFSPASLNSIIQDMQNTMHEKGGVGIAAPQIGINKRIIMFGFDSNDRYPNEKPIPFTILINPTIEILSGEMIGLRGLVSRFKHIRYQGFNQNGQEIQRVAEGFHARVVQHEYDHIEGILYPQRIKDLKYFGYEDELKDVIWPN